MVCLGNICRSPTAEAVLRHKLERAGLGERVLVDSAGTYGGHAGDPPDPRAQRHAAARGYDLSRLKARQVEDADFDRFDLVLAMDRSNLRSLAQAAPEGATAQVVLLGAYASNADSTVDASGAGGRDAAGEIPDPYYGPPAGFERVLDLVEAACEGLVQTLRRDLDHAVAPASDAAPPAS